MDSEKRVALLSNNGVNVSKSLGIFGDFVTYEEALKVFRQEVNINLSLLQKHKDSGNMSEYAVVAHSVKSDAKYLGFEYLGELAYEHELASKSGKSYFIYENYNSLIEEVLRIIKIVDLFFTPKEETKILDNHSLNSAAKTDEKCVMIVDDSEIIRNICSKILSSSFKILMAKDGEEAISVLEEALKNNENISAVLLDLNMPKVDGLAVLEHFKQNDLFKKIPVSIITGNEMEEIDRKAFAYPIVDVLKKPFTERNVKDMVEKCVNSIK